MIVETMIAANPLSVPAKVYDRMWVEELIVSAPRPGEDATARVKLRRFTVVDGRAELEPAGGEWLVIDDILAKSDADSDLGHAVASLMACIAKAGREAGVVL